MKKRIFTNRLRWSDNRGFTMLEVLVSAGIVGVGLMALSAMQVTAMRGNAGGQRLTAATQIAMSKVEELKSMQYYQDITNASNIHAPDVVVPTSGELNEGERNERIQADGQACNNEETIPCPYTLNWVIQDVGDQHSRAAAKRIEVWVTWADSDSDTLTAEVRLPPTLLPIKFF